LEYHIDRIETLNFEEKKMAYSDKVIDHYNNPRNVGQMDKSSAKWAPAWSARRSAATSCAADQGQPETQVIEEAKFKTFGCGSAIASSSLATEWVKGKTVEKRWRSRTPTS
jgi:nitrogen fixation NifU-like protein